ncbi:MAG: 50S ribosomal protein L29 [Candidatus Aenigmarchaeota archaeon]|nr:50S ribosomal protein L29 [Candidatus Aenigmarchaeota archaeon]
MSILRTKDMRKLGEKEIEKRLAELKLEMAKERANISIGATTASPGKIREIRKTIARINTIKKEKIG